MVGLGVVLGTRVVVIAGEVAGRVVFCAIHHTGLQRGEHLAISHRDAIAPHGVHGVHKQRVAHHAHLLALQIGGGTHGLFGVEAAGASIHPANGHQLGRRCADLGQQLVANRAVYHRARMFLAAEDERQVEHVDLWHHGTDRAQRSAQDVDGTHLGLLDHFLFATQHTTWEGLDFEAAIGGSFELLAHAFNGHHVGVARGVHVGSLEHHGLSAGAQRCCAQREHSAGVEKSTTNHDECLLGWVCVVVGLTRRRVIRKAPCARTGRPGR